MPSLEQRRNSRLDVVDRWRVMYVFLSRHPHKDGVDDSKLEERNNVTRTARSRFQRRSSPLNMSRFSLPGIKCISCQALVYSSLAIFSTTLPRTSPLSNSSYTLSSSSKSLTLTTHLTLPILTNSTASIVSFILPTKLPTTLNPLMTILPILVWSVGVPGGIPPHDRMPPIRKRSRA